MISPAAPLDRVLLQQAQSWRSLAGIANLRARSSNLFHEVMDHSRDSAKPSEKIQRRPFTGEYRAGFPLEMKQDRSSAQQIAVMNAQLNLRVRIECAKHFFRHRQSRAHQIFTSDDARLSRRAGGNCGQDR